MGDQSPNSAAATAAKRDLLGHVEPFEMLLDAGFVDHRTGMTAVLVTNRRLLWRLVEPERSPVLALAFDAVCSIVVDDGMSVRLVCRPESGRLDAHSFEFQAEDAGLRLIVLDRATRALRRRRPQLFLVNRHDVAE